MRYTIATLQEFWSALAASLPKESRAAAALQDDLESALDALRTDPPLAGVRRQALSDVGQIVDTRRAMSEHSGRLVPDEQFILLIVWLAMISGGIGLLARGSIAVFAGAVPCAAAMAGTLFFIREFDEPFGGMMVVSGEPLLVALHALVGN